MRRLFRTREDLWDAAYMLLFVGLFFGLYGLILHRGIVPGSISLFDFFLLVASTFRIIRLITYDKISDFIRQYFSESTSALGKTTYSLLICVWCTGIWAALFVTAIYYLLSQGWLFLLILSISGVASFVQVLTNAIIRGAEKTAVEKEILESEGSYSTPGEESRKNIKF